MTIELGIKSDPIVTRFSFEWLFDLLDRLDVRFVQMGSYPEIYTAEDGFFLDLKEKAEKRNVLIKSCFTTYRDLAGFLTGDPYLERAARKIFERMIHVAALVGADSTGGHGGSVFRDRIDAKERGIDVFLAHMKELMFLAKDKGLKSLTIEPMSCLAEHPTLPDEIDRMTSVLDAHHREQPDATVPVYLCPDIGHGYADRNQAIIHDNWYLFEQAIPHTSEFHFKNTDSVFAATFGFAEEEKARGIIDLQRLKALLEENAHRFPVETVVGYLEISGPKIGRDYSDYQLERMIIDSLESLKAVYSGDPF